MTGLELSHFSQKKAVKKFPQNWRGASVYDEVIYTLLEHFMQKTKVSLFFAHFPPRRPDYKFTLVSLGSLLSGKPVFRVNVFLSQKFYHGLSRIFSRFILGTVAISFPYSFRLVILGIPHLGQFAWANFAFNTLQL